MSDFAPEAKRVSSEKVYNLITTLTSKGYRLMVSEEDIIGCVAELYVRYDKAISHSGFVGVGGSLEEALEDLVNDERLELGEAE